MAKQATKLAELPVTSNETHPMHEDIAALAYALWQEKGCPEGTHEEDWLNAEHDLIASSHRAD